MPIYQIRVQWCSNCRRCDDARTAVACCITVAHSAAAPQTTRPAAPVICPLGSSMQHTYAIVYMFCVAYSGFVPCCVATSALLQLLNANNSCQAARNKRSTCSRKAKCIFSDSCCRDESSPSTAHAEHALERGKHVNLRTDPTCTDCTFQTRKPDINVPATCRQKQCRHKCL